MFSSPLVKEMRISRKIREVKLVLEGLYNEREKLVSIGPDPEQEHDRVYAWDLGLINERIETLEDEIDNLECDYSYLTKDRYKGYTMKKILKIKIGGRVIEFKKTNAVFCEVKDGWDLDFMNLKDGWIYQLESEKYHRHYLRMINNGKSVKILYSQVMYREDGEFQTFALSPIVVWISNNEDHSQGSIFQNNYLFHTLCK